MGCGEGVMRPGRGHRVVAIVALVGVLMLLMTQVFSGHQMARGHWGRTPLWAVAVPIPVWIVITIALAGVTLRLIHLRHRLSAWMTFGACLVSIAGVIVAWRGFVGWLAVV